MIPAKASAEGASGPKTEILYRGWPGVAPAQRKFLNRGSAYADATARQVTLITRMEEGEKIRNSIRHRSWSFSVALFPIRVIRVIRG